MTNLKNKNIFLYNFLFYTIFLKIYYNIINIKNVVFLIL